MEHLIEYLKANRISQAEFAQRIGRTQSAVSKLCSGQSRPGWDTAAVIERATDGAVPATSWVPESNPPSQEDAA